MLFFISTSGSIKIHYVKALDPKAFNLPLTKMIITNYFELS